MLDDDVQNCNYMGLAIIFCQYDNFASPKFSINMAILRA